MKKSLSFIEKLEKLEKIVKTLSLLKYMKCKEGEWIIQRDYNWEEKKVWVTVTASHFSLEDILAIENALKLSEFENRFISTTITSKGEEVILKIFF